MKNLFYDEKIYKKMSAKKETIRRKKIRTEKRRKW